MGFQDKENVIVQIDNKEMKTLLAQNASDANRANKMPFKLNKGFVAHRGLQSMAPENTIKAIAEAGRLGYKMVEIDPRLTSDGIWILMHDDTVDRTTDGTGTVSTMTLAQIQALKIDTPTVFTNGDEIFRAPLLEDVLKEVAYWGMGVNLDGTKYNMTQDNILSLAGLLDKYNLTEKSLFVCTTWESRQLVKAYVPVATVMWLANISDIDNEIAVAKTFKSCALGISSSSLTDVMVEKCHKAGIHVYAYSANDLKTAYQWINRGVSYVETDFILPGGVY